MGGYTPGPWSFDSLTHYVTDAETERTQIAHVLGLGMWGIWDEEAAANARLIASAPELLERLKEARDAIASLPEYALGGENIVHSHDGDIVGHYPIRDELLHHINAAISRATGEGE